MRAVVQIVRDASVEAEGVLPKPNLPFFGQAYILL